MRPSSTSPTLTGRWYVKCCSPWRYRPPARTSPRHRRRSPAYIEPGPPSGCRSGNAPESVITNVNVGGTGMLAKPARRARRAATGRSGWSRRPPGRTASPGPARPGRAPPDPTRSTRHRRAVRSTLSTRRSRRPRPAGAAAPVRRARWNDASPNESWSSCAALHEEVQVVLPREADAAVHLQRRRHHALRRVGAPRLRGRRRDRRRRRSPAPMHHAAQYDGRPHALDVDEHVGAAVLHRLERTDRPAELHAVLRVLDRQVERARRAPEQIRRARTSRRDRAARARHRRRRAGARRCGRTRASRARG